MYYVLRSVSMIYKMIFLCIAGFLASFIDSIAGGGGLISVPAFMLAGLSPHIVLGTNKLAATTGSFTSSLKFAKSGLCNFDLLKKLIPFTLVGSIIGVRTVLLIDQKFLQPLVLVLVLCIGVYTLFSKSLGQEDNFKGLNKKNTALGMLLAFTLGFYDGFFGPGTGSFLVFGMINIFGFNFLNASANARFLNFISNITALVTFAFSVAEFQVTFPALIISTSGGLNPIDSINPSSSIGTISI